ncbi:MAG: InlB B-repeat-containing protein, partial [Prevotella sp.]|nr:InlB B-repeat-containing protein [Prevotella sp.]
TLVDSRSSGNYVVGTPVTKDITLKAEWAGVPVVATFDANGGQFADLGDDTTTVKKEDVTQTYGSGYVLPANAPTMDGYKFAGWYTKAEGGEAITSVTEVGSVVLEDGKTVYAHWDNEVYTVTFMVDGEVYATQTVAGGEKAILPGIEPVKEGAELDGWYTAGKVKYDFEADTNKVTSDLTLYAEWVPATCYVVVVANETVNVSDIDDLDDLGLIPLPVPYGTVLPKVPEAIEREGYKLTGWKDANGEPFDFDKPITDLITFIVADWTANEYTVYFDANGGAVDPTSKAVTFDQSIGEMPTPTYEGNVFVGWYTEKASDAGVPVISSSKITVADNQTLYAHWATEYHKVTVNTNDDSWTIEPFYRAHGTCVGTIEAPTGYDFGGFTLVGWTDDATGEFYNLGAPVTEDVSISAVWMPNIYTVVFNGNGGEGSMDPQFFFADEEESLYANEFTRAGYTFMGWAQQDGSEIPTEADFTDEETVGFTYNTTLYAVWEPIWYTISYNYNGASPVDNPESYSVAQLALTLLNPVKEGATFLGWTGSNGTEPQLDVVIAPGTTGNLNFVANWSSDTYEVTFNANGGTGEMGKQGFTAGQAKALSENKFTREGYTFIGWATAPGATTATYADQETYTAEKSITLYAVWVENTANIVTFDANTGDGVMIPQVFDGEHAQALTKNAFTKDGYVFVGWAEQAIPPVQGGTSDVVYNDESTQNFTYSTTLYAIWEKA